MIRAHNIWMNRRFSDTWSDSPWYQEIIYSPTRVIGSCISEVWPPCIEPLFSWMLLTKNINKSSIKKFIKTMSFLMSKTMWALILFGIFEIYWLVCNIKVSAKNNRFMCLKFFYKWAHRLIPLLTVRKTRKVIFGIWYVGSNIVEILEFESQSSPLIVSFGANAIHNSHGGYPSKDSRSRVSRTLRGIKNTFIS